MEIDKEKLINILVAWNPNGEYPELVADTILNLFGVVKQNDLLICPECGRTTKITNHAKTMARCFYCGNKWEI